MVCRPSRGPAADGEHIVLGRRANVSNIECQQRGGATRSRHELDLEAVRLANFHHSAKVAFAQAMLGQVAVQNDGVELAIRHRLPSGYAVTNLGKSSRGRMIQPLTTRAERPDGPTRVARISYVCPCRVRFPSTAS